MFSLEVIFRLPGIKAPARLYEEIEDPDIRWVHLAGFEGKWGRTGYIKINSQGLRDREYPFDKPKDTFRIFAVGECLIVGDSVALEDSFVKQLEGMDDEALGETLVSWIRSHDGLLEYAEFAASNRMSVARVSLGVDQLLKQGYIRRM